VPAGAMPSRYRSPDQARGQPALRSMSRYSLLVMSEWWLSISSPRPASAHWLNSCWSFLSAWVLINVGSGIHTFLMLHFMSDSLRWLKLKIPHRCPRMRFIVQIARGKYRTADLRRLFRCNLPHLRNPAQSSSDLGIG